MTTTELAALSSEHLRRVVRRTMSYDFTVWFWGDAIAIDGLLDAAEMLRDPSAREFVLKYFKRWLDQPETWTDYLTPGSALVRLHRATADETLLSRARKLAGWYMNAVPRAPGTGLHLYRPDLPAYRHTIWVDSLYHVPSFFALLGVETGDPIHLDEAVASYESHAEALESERGPLLAHSLDTGARRQKGYGWGRGNAWALCGLVDLLEQLPPDHPRHAGLLRRLEGLCAALRPLQDETGCWRTLLHDREAYLETSTAAMYGFAFAKAIRLGLLSAEYGPAAEAAARYALAHIDEDGGCWGVSAVTWSWTSPHDETGLYKLTPTEVNVWGQGAALRLLAELSRDRGR